MRIFNWFIVLLGLSLLGTVALPRYVPGAWRPDVFLLLILFTALYAETEEALSLCWIVGFAKDLLTIAPMGQYALLGLALGFAVVRTRQQVDTRAAIPQMALGFLGYSVTEGIALLADGFRLGAWPDSATRQGLFTAAMVTGLAAPFLMRLMDALGGWLGTRRRRYGMARAS